jgi:hypothetical protein
MDVQWVKLESVLSWHILKDRKTLCGYDIEDADEVRDELGAEKSCENCLRVYARKEDLASEPTA